MKTHSDRQQLKTVRISKYGSVLYYAGKIPLLNLSLSVEQLVPLM
jgi:hypothetical protein